MPRIDNEKFYLAALKLHGMSPKGVHWHSNESQQIRFEVLLSLCTNDITTKSIVDAGCGFGDFYHFLQAQHAMPTSYIGIDSVKQMCSIAKEQTQSDILHFDILKEELPQADYYFCSGAMNILSEYESFVFIRNCFMACREAFIFNVLHGTKESQTYNYMTKEQIQNYAKELGAWHVEFREGYLEGDISVGFYKKSS
jgi:SAM-dependent methyltransferase